MKMDFDVAKQIEYTANSVMERGYEIHDEWVKSGYSSRKIVKFAEHAVASAQAKKTSADRVEALSCLFALDIRIKEKYNTPLQCIFSYFSWRREMRAFRTLKGSFNIPDNNEDIRTAIEVELQRLREKLEDEDTDDDDDTIRGGKRNGKSAEELVADQKKAQDQASNEDPEESLKAEEKKESAIKKAEKKSEPVQTNELTEEIKAQQDLKKTQSSATQILPQENKEEAKEEFYEIKEENNVSDQHSDPSADKPKDAKTYNDAIDSPPPIFDHSAAGKFKIDTKSFIDEVIIDNMVKGKDDAVRHNPLEDAKQVHEENRTENALTQNSGESKSIDKNAYLYDKMVTSDKGGAHQAQKISEIKTTQIATSAQNSNEAVKGQGVGDLRVPLQVDISVDQENEMRREISNSMSAEAIKAIYESQAAAMREQLTIASAELGMDAPVEIIGIPETVPPEQSAAGPNRK